MISNMAETRIIFTHGGGRLANQLISHAHLLAFCAAHAGRFSLCNTAMWAWREQFAQLPVYPDKACRPSFPAQLCEALLKAAAGQRGNNAFRRLIYRLAGYLPSIARTRTGEIGGAFLVQADPVPTIDLARHDTVALLGKAPIHMLCGWQIRSWPLVQTHRAMILERMRPSLQIASSAKHLIMQVRNGCDFLIGVHIRRGDYRLYREGRFFYDLTQYAAWMRQLQKRYSGHGKIGFLICSDEQFPLDPFEGLNVRAAWEFESAPPLRDNAALSLCDILVAPPSTFALWAAFSGGIPLLVLSNSSIDLENEPPIRDSFFDWLNHPLFTEFSP